MDRTESVIQLFIPHHDINIHWYVLQNDEVLTMYTVFTENSVPVNLICGSRMRPTWACCSDQNCLYLLFLHLDTDTHMKHFPDTAKVQATIIKEANMHLDRLCCAGPRVLQ